MPTEVTSLAEAQIRELIDGYGKAVRARDVNGITANYAKDVVIFDAIPPLKYTGAETYRKNWQECFDMLEGPVGYENKEIHISTDNELAFAHCLSRLSGTIKNEGKKMEMWLRATVGFRKIGGKWLVTHEHASVPFYPESEKAATDLKP